MTAAKLSPEDIAALRDAILPVLARQIEQVDCSIQRRFDRVDMQIALVTERLDSLAARVLRLEERVAGLVDGFTRSRTEDVESLAALEARVEALEKALAAKG